MPQVGLSISEQLGAILKRWQERLIDVSKSNPLLGLNRSRAAKLEVEAADLNKLAIALLSDSGPIKLPFVQKVKKALELDLNEDLGLDIEKEREREAFILHEGDISFIYQNLGDLKRKIRKIFDSSRVTMNERGVNTLYLAIGCLEWSDPMMGKSDSPLVMIPCEFEYKGASKPLNLVMADEDVILNPAIRYYLKEREEIDLPEIPDEFDASLIDSFLETISKQVAPNGWKVTRRAWLGIFSFESLAIYQDLKMLDMQARNNPLVQAIAHLGGEVIENLHLDDELDAMQTPEQIPVPVVQADSSQLRAITLASKGSNLVIHGPPGTGKSQTITGIIADALSQNKKVLFVSSKMAALNVVHSRLQSMGLGQYCLEAHGVKSGKKKVIDELKRSLEATDDIKIAKSFNEDLAKMVKSRCALNDYVKALHDKKNELSVSAFSAYGIFESLHDTPLVKAPLPWSNVLEVSSHDLDYIKSILREVSDNSLLFSKRDGHPLRGMKSGGIDLLVQERLEQHLQKIISFCEEVERQAKKLSNFFLAIDLSTFDLFSSTGIFEELSKINELPLDWNIKSIEELNIKLKEIIECADTFRRKEESLEKFRTFSSKSPKEVLNLVDGHLKKYPIWYSKMNLRYLQDKKECKAVLDKVNKLFDLFSSTGIFEELSKINELPLDWNIKSIEELNIKLKEIIECADTFRRKEESLEKFRTFSSKSPKEVLNLVDGHLKKYPIWYSKMNLRYLQDKKECKAVLDKVNKLNRPLLDDAVACIQKLLLAESEFMEKVGKLPLNEFSDSDDILKNIVYFQRKYETAIFFNEWLDTAGISMDKDPIFTADTSSSFFILVDILKSLSGDIYDIQQELLNCFPKGLSGQTEADIGLLSSNGSLLNEIITCAQEFLQIEDEFIEKIGKLSLNELNINEDIFEGLMYAQKKFETVISLKKWLNVAKTTLVTSPVFTAETANLFSGLIGILDSAKDDLSVIQQELGINWPEGLLGQIKIDTEPLSIVKSSTKMVLEGLNQTGVRNWQIISRIVDRCTNNEILPFVQKMSSDELSMASDIFTKRFFYLWIDAMIHSNPVLSEFSGSTQVDLIEKYKMLDQKVMRLNVLNAIAVPAQNAQEVKNAHTGVGFTSGVGILRREMEKKKRLKPLRVLFNEIPRVLQALKPCFLMSPLSVSTFLKPGEFNFDLVIFDEASQLPTPEAIPSILRARQVIVAGDSKQLPPSSFFRTSVADDSGEWEEGQIEELESLLDDCKAAVPFFQETDLKWHYRSRDERLISFSNHYYYENRLITFPSPSTDSKKSGVVLEYVPEGVWDRGGSRINRKEARRVAELIIQHFKTEPEKTLGVVAFNSSQKEAIEDALEEELQNHKDFGPLIDPEKDEPFFIKSLENVQGDERDVIIISVGYGKAQDGKMSLNFGPINSEGGWRRLNVLVTRSKWKTILVTSIRSSELIGINPENKGPVGLKNYIQYAETGFLNESREAAHVLLEETNDFEDSVRRELELRGFKVDAQVGVGSFKIDLAVRDPKNPTGYAIGVECDGASYHSSRSARDRDILRQEILQGMGWKFHRVWSTEWFKDKEMSVRLLVESVNRAVSGQGAVGSNKTLNSEEAVAFEEVDNLRSVTSRKNKSGVEYVKTEARCRRDVIIDSDRVHQFSDVIVRIVSDEGPIHVDLVLDRIKELANVSRVGSNIQANFDAAVRIAVKDGEIEKIKEDKGFLHRVGRKGTHFRTPGDGVVRSLGQISQVEIKNAIIFLIKDQFGLAHDNVIQSIKHVFGIGRIDPQESDRVKDLIDAMIESSELVRHGPLLHLAEL